MALRLTKAEWIRLKEVRAIRDLRTVGKLWGIFEENKELMWTFRGLCSRGLRLIHKEVLPYDTTKKEPDTDPKWYKDYIGSFACKMLDCWPNGGPNTKGRRRLRYLRGKDDTAAQTYFKDLGMIGGYFRYHAEVCETKAEKANDSSEDEGRQSWQKFIEYRPESGGDYATDRYTNKWFTKWQDKRVAKTDETKAFYEKYAENERAGAKMQHQRARYSRKEEEQDAPDYVKPFIHRPKGKENYITGITLHHQSSWDRLRLISQLHGLPPGATISGTTTDHMYTLFHVLGTAEQDKTVQGKKFIKAVYKYMPFIVLLPTVQMVRQYHHALIETAASLSLNDLISYRVGYYSTLLMPWQEGCTWSKPVYDRVKKTLTLADSAVPHVYAMDDGSIERKKPKNFVAVMANPRNEKEMKAHYDEALLNPNTVKKFEDIPEKITWEYVQRKLSKLRVDRHNL